MRALCKVDVPIVSVQQTTPKLGGLKKYTICSTGKAVTWAGLHRKGPFLLFTVSTMVSLLPDRNRPRAGLPQASLQCGFLTSCRKDSASPGDFESTLIKPGDSETKEGFSVKEVTGALTGGAPWIGRHLTNQKVPSQGTCLGFRPGLQVGNRQLIDVSRTHRCLSP